VVNIVTTVLQGFKREVTTFAGMERQYEILMWIFGNI
jgi:hypothetical protein